MKLILTHNGVTKLMETPVEFKAFIEFLQKEFNLKAGDYQLSFNDEDGDEIAIVSDSDLQVMNEVYSGKDYVKVVINLNSQRDQVKEQEQGKTAPITEEYQATEQGEDQGWHCKFGKGKCDEQKGKYNWKKHCKPWLQSESDACQWRKKRAEWREAHQNEQRTGEQPRNYFNWKGNKIELMKKYVENKVTELVDERLKTMMPIIKNQLSNEVVPTMLAKNPVHIGTTCNSCSGSLVTGIIYKCPTCTKFYLCEKCEQTVSHHHNMLKMKHIEEQPNNCKTDKRFNKITQKILNKLLTSSSSSSSQKDHRSYSKKWKRGYGNKKCQKLVDVFGGQVDDYKQFVEKHKDFRPREILECFAKENNIPVQVFQEKFDVMRCKRLAEKFNQPAEKYKQVVKDNHAMRFHELVRHLIDIGMEKKENCQWKKEDWEGRKHHPWHHGHHGNHCHHGDWHKHRGHHSKSGERSDEQKCPKKDCVQKCQRKENQKTVEQQKAKLVLMLNDFINQDKTAQHTVFVNENWSLGKLRLLEKWFSQNLS